MLKNRKYKVSKIYGCPKRVYYRKGRNKIPSEKGLDIAEIIKELQDIVPKVENAWKDYAELYIQYHTLYHKILHYVKTGTIDKSRIPKYNKKKLIENLIYAIKHNERNMEDPINYGSDI